MSSRSYLLLFAATVAAVLIAASALLSERNAYADQDGPTGLLFPALGNPETEVTGLEAETPTYALQLVAEGEGWVASSHANYPARAQLATDLIADIAGMQPVEAKTRRAEWYSLVGVEDRTAKGARSRLVKLLGNDAELAEVLVGKTSTSLGADLIGGTFVRLAKDEQTWLASGIVEFPPTFSAWFEDLLNIPGPDLNRISISKGDKLLFDAAKIAGQATYSLQFVDAAYSGEGEIIDDVLLRRIAQVLVSLPFESVRDAEEVTVPEDGRSLRFETNDGLVLHVRVAQDEVASPWVLINAESQTESVGSELAARINGKTERWAFKLTNGKMLALLISIADLLLIEEPTVPEGMGQVFPGGVAPGGGEAGGMVPGSILPQGIVR